MLYSENDSIKFGEEFEKEEYGLIDNGDYEVVLKAEVKKTKDGSKDFLNLDYKIREDVDQPFKGRHLFEAAWRDKNKPELFDFKKINSLILTQKELPTYQTQFKEMDEVILYLNGLHMIVSVETLYDEFLAQDKNYVVKRSYRPSEWDKAHTKGSVQTATTFPPELGDDEFPF